MAKILEMPQKALVDYVLYNPEYYIMVPVTIIGAFYKRTRGIGTHLYTVKHYSNDNTTKLGTTSDEFNEAAEIKKRRMKLEAFMDQNHENAESEIYQIPTRIPVFEDRQHGFVAIYVICKDGIIGCAWYSSDRLDVYSKKMAAFTLYALGVININYDDTLWTTTYYYLPKQVVELGSIQDADESIVQGLAEAKFKSS